MDYVVISDLHLGSKLCLRKRLIEFLTKELDGESTLIINGDLVESLNFDKFKKKDWNILKLIKKFHKLNRLKLIRGNHDEPYDKLSTMLGLPFVQSYDIGHIHIRHGDSFDEFLMKHPVLTAIGDFIYEMLQYMDRSHMLARKAKKIVKKHLDISMKAVGYAMVCKYKVIICGHTHLPVHVHINDVDYYNTGCWTEKPGTYIRISKDKITLEEFG